MEAGERLCRQNVFRGPAFGRQGVVEGVLVERVHEAEALARLAAGELDVADRLDQAVSRLQRAQALLDLHLVALGELGHDGAGELEPLDARGGEQPLVGLVEPFDLLADERHHPFGHDAVHRVERAGEHHPVAVAGDGARLQEMIEDVQEKERIALGAAQGKVDELGRRRCAELALEKGCDLAVGERRRRDLAPRQVAAAEAGEHGAQRMALRLDVGRAVGRDQHAA